MQSMTLEEFRTVSEAGDISSVTLKGQGGAFLVQIATRSGSTWVLAKDPSSEPRRFSNPATALNVLRAVGITKGQFDVSGWNPDAREPVQRSSNIRANGLRNAQAVAAYNQWLASEIQEAVDDPRWTLPHDEVMAEMDADIAALTTGRKSAARRRV